MVARCANNEINLPITSAASMVDTARKSLINLAFWATFPVLGGCWMLYRLLLAPSRVHPDDSEGGGKRKRSMSFSSYQMLQGCFSDDAGSWDTIINNIFYFDELPAEEKIIAKTREMLFYDRFRCAAVKRNGRYYFVEISDEIDVIKHVLRTVVVSDETEMHETIDLLCTETIPVQENGLLWRVYRIINEGTGRSAMFVRIHHALADGLSLVGVLMKLFDDKDGNPLKIDMPGVKGASSAKSSSKKSTMPSPWSLRSLWTIVRCAINVLSAPVGSFDSDLMFGPSKKKYLKFNDRRKTVYLPVLKLSFVKKLKDCAGVTVNDVMMAITTGMLQRYCQMKGDPNFASAAAQSKVRARMLLPVAFPRSLEELQSPVTGLRNLWALVSVPIPLNEQSSEARLQQCKTTTAQMKNEPSALIQYWVQSNILSRAPIFLQKKTGHDFFSRHTMVFSNVPGPQEPVYYAGAKMVGIQVLFPNLLPQALILSYDGGIYFNLNIDPDVTDRFAELPRLFMEEAKALGSCYGLATDDTSLLH